MKRLSPMEEKGDLSKVTLQLGGRAKTLGSLSIVSHASGK